jgi:UDP-N-acetylmuramoyl-L-alanyl-D-glutamate--2,6-diaminopimelate ligase
MGEIAASLADTVIVTDDNPRSEDAATIRADIIAGTGAPGRRTKVMEIGDRSAAIAAALQGAKQGDTVVIAGKGHEAGQQVGDQTLPFDDRLMATRVLDRLGIEATR